MPRNSRARCYIGRLKEGVVSTRDIEQLFSKYGRIVDLTLKSNYGFIEFETEQMAEAAVFEMNRKEFMGDRIIVEHARPSADDSNQKKNGRPSRGRSPSPVRYDAMPQQRPAMFQGAGNFPNFSMQPHFPPFAHYNPVMAPRPMIPEILPFRSMDSQRPDFHRNGGAMMNRNRDWSPRGAGSRRRSRSRSPLDRSKFKKARRSPPLRVNKRAKSPMGAKKQVLGKFDQPTKARSNWRICIENLKHNVTWQDLRRHFNEVGEVVYASVASDASGFVEFAKKEMVAKAVTRFNDTNLKGSRIQVIDSIPPEAEEDVEPMPPVEAPLDGPLEQNGHSEAPNNQENGHSEESNEKDANGALVDDEKDDNIVSNDGDSNGSNGEGSSHEQEFAVVDETNGNGSEAPQVEAIVTNGHS